MSARVRLRPLEARTPEAVALVRRLVAGCDDYYRLVHGRAPGEEDVDDVFGAAVPGVGPGDIHSWIVEVEGEPAGYAGLLSGWKRPGQSMIGMLALDARHRRRGAGRAAVAALEDFARATPHGRSMRIGIVETNAAAFAFWRALGYRETGERRALEGFVAPIVLLEKALDAA